MMVYCVFFNISEIVNKMLLEVLHSQNKLTY